MGGFFVFLGAFVDLPAKRIAHAILPAGGEGMIYTVLGSKLREARKRAG